MVGVLAAGTLVAGRDILVDEGTHLGPEVVAGDQFKGLGAARVSGGRGVVVHGEDPELNIGAVGDIDETLVQDKVGLQEEVAEDAFVPAWRVRARVAEEVLRGSSAYPHLTLVMPISTLVATNSHAIHFEFTCTSPQVHPLLQHQL